MDTFIHYGIAAAAGRAGRWGFHGEALLVRSSPRALPA